MHNFLSPFIYVSYYPMFKSLGVSCNFLMGSRHETFYFKLLLLHKLMSKGIQRDQFFFGGSFERESESSKK